MVFLLRYAGFGERDSWFGICLFSRTPNPEARTPNCFGNSLFQHRHQRTFNQRINQRGMRIVAAGGFAGGAARVQEEGVGRDGAAVHIFGVNGDAGGEVEQALVDAADLLHVQVGVRDALQRPFPLDESQGADGPEQFKVAATQGFVVRGLGFGNFIRTTNP
jgi:hypothetical protein